MGSKIVFFLAWLGILILAFLGLGYVVYPEYFFSLDTDSVLFKGLILNISIIYIVIVFMKIKTYFAKEEDYVIENEFGSVHISTDTVRRIISELLLKDNDIKSVKVLCNTKNKNEYYVGLNLDLVSGCNFSTKTDEIQNKIKNELEGKLNLVLKNIEVKISSIKPSRKSD